MNEFDRREVFVRVRDANGDLVCPLKALRNPKDLSPEDLDNCVDSATVNRYAGDIEIVGGK
ncbi:MAG: hypothetical protein V2B19_22085 [Pseudomonadota bacterium]